MVTAAIPGEPKRAAVDGVAIRRLPAVGWTPSLRMACFGASAFLHLLATRRHWDVLHVVGISWHCYTGILAARLLHKRVVVEMVMLGDDDPASIAALRFGALKLAIWKRADRVASLSSALTEAARSAGIPPERIPEIPVGVDTELFRPLPDSDRDPEARRRLRERLGLPPSGRLAVFVGAIMARKGVDTLVEAWPAVLAAVPEAHLLLVGPRDLTPEDRLFREELDRRIDALGIRERVHFAGRVDGVETRLQAADLFVLPSLTEGLPNSLLEAMACAVPTLMTDLPGIARDVIRSEEEGFLLPERTPEALAAAIADLLPDEERRRAMGAAGRKRILEAFSIAGRAERYAALYRSLLEPP